MSEADRRPPRNKASISVDLEGPEIVVKGKWSDGSGKKHDLGFAKLRSWPQVRLVVVGMADLLQKLAEDKTDGH